MYRQDVARFLSPTTIGLFGLETLRQTRERCFAVRLQPDSADWLIRWERERGLFDLCDLPRISRQHYFPRYSSPDTHKPVPGDSKCVGVQLENGLRGFGRLWPESFGLTVVRPIALGKDGRILQWMNWLPSMGKPGMTHRTTSRSQSNSQLQTLHVSGSNHTKFWQSVLCWMFQARCISESLSILSNSLSAFHTNGRQTPHVLHLLQDPTVGLPLNPGGGGCPERSKGRTSKLLHRDRLLLPESDGSCYWIYLGKFWGEVRKQEELPHKYRLLGQSGPHIVHWRSNTY
jgi:hypothetical protein